MSKFQIEPRFIKIIKDIFLSANLEVYIFGSRAKNTARKLSDLDLCIKSTVDKTTLRKLKTACEESNLPFKVDIVVWSELSDSFKNQIEKDLVRFL